MSQRGLHILGPGEAPPSQPEGSPETGNPAVLLVEDDAAIVSSLGEALREEGLHVVIAENGRAALEVLRNRIRPSMIVLDLMMPVMDGWDFRQEQLRDPALKDIPVVVITATGFSQDTIRAQFGNVVVLPKPVPYLALLALLGRGLASVPPDGTTRDEPSVA